MPYKKVQIGVIYIHYYTLYGLVTKFKNGNLFWSLWVNIFCSLLWLQPKPGGLNYVFKGYYRMPNDMPCEQ